jgi:hypothetical protein
VVSINPSNASRLGRNSEQPSLRLSLSLKLSPVYDPGSSCGGYATLQKGTPWRKDVTA